MIASQLTLSSGRGSTAIVAAPIVVRLAPTTNWSLLITELEAPPGVFPNE